MTAEQGGKGEQLSPAEIGKQNYDAIALLASNLIKAPEFVKALEKAYFARQWSRETSRNELNWVGFAKGDFQYLVEWGSRRFRPSSHGKHPTLDLIETTLKITKYDPTEKTQDSLGDWMKKVAETNVSTSFVEAEDKSILRFTDGWSRLEEDYQLEASWETPHSWRSAKPDKKIEGTTVIGQMPRVFKDIYRFN